MISDKLIAVCKLSLGHRERKRRVRNTSAGKRRHGENGTDTKEVLSL